MEICFLFPTFANENKKIIMLVVVFIITLLLGVYIMAIAPIKNDKEYREENAKNPIFWIIVIVVCIILAFVSVGNCSGD